MNNAVEAVEVVVAGSNIMGVPSSKITAIISALVAVTLAIIGVFKLWMRQQPQMREIDINDERSARMDLMHRLDKIESDYAAEKASWNNRFDLQRAQYEATRELDRAIHQSELAISRHRMNNLDQCLQMILALIEANPDDPVKVKEAARRVREMREKQEIAEALEKAAAAAATVSNSNASVAAVGVPGSPVPAPGTTPPPHPVI